MYLNMIMELLRRADERTLERVYFLLRGWITDKMTDGGEDSSLCSE